MRARGDPASSRALFVAVLAATLAPAALLAEAPTTRTRLAVSLFGETVGEVRLTRRGGPETTLSYRSDVLVVRDRVRLRQRAFIEVTCAPGTFALVRSTARRCTGPEDESQPPTCTRTRTLGAKDGGGAVPALAAELALAELTARSPGEERCVEVVDEESGTRGRACARAAPAPGGVELSGGKFEVAFRAQVAGGALVLLELPAQGARFSPVEGELQLSDEDLFADPIPASGDVLRGVRLGRLRIRVMASPGALAALRTVSAPGQRILEEAPDSLLLEITRVRPPRTPKSRRLLDHAALLVATARGGHVDCQTATAWFLARARERGWNVRPAVGFAWVDGRFAFHQWAVVDTPEGPIPMDPLLAQVPADAGHVQLANLAESAGELLVAIRGGLSLVVE